MEASGSFTPKSLYPRESAPGTRWIGGWVGNRVGLKTVAKGKNSITASAENRASVLRPVAQSPYWLSYCDSLTLRKG